MNIPSGLLDKTKTPPLQMQNPQAMPEQPAAPDIGGLPIRVVAMIQGIYQREEQKKLQIQANQQSIGLQKGWGGQGR